MTKNTKRQKVCCWVYLPYTIWSNRSSRRCPLLLVPDILLALRPGCPSFHSNTTSCHPTRTLESQDCNHMGAKSSEAVVSLVGASMLRCQVGAGSTTRVSTRAT